MNNIQNFKQFWYFYLSQHQSAVNRYLHLCGFLLALVVFGCGIFYTLSWWWLLPICGYGFAWIGHFFIECNRPATFSYPVWSLMADVKMCVLMLTGGLNRELDQAQQLIDNLAVNRAEID